MHSLKPQQRRWPSILPSQSGATEEVSAPPVLLSVRWRTRRKLLGEGSEARSYSDARCKRSYYCPRRSSTAIYGDNARSGCRQKSPRDLHLHQRLMIESDHPIRNTAFSHTGRCSAQYSHYLLPGSHHAQAMGHRNRIDGLRFFAFMSVILVHSDVTQC